MAGFLELGAWDVGGTTFEVVSRRRLDTRQVVPFFDRDGERFVGLLERARAARIARGVDPVGLEPIGIDFGGVDETGDVLEYGKAIFSEHARVKIDDSKLKIPLPSYARSIGYLTEISLPLIVPIEPPPTDVVDVAWDGEAHRIVFRPLAAWLRDDAGPRSEDVALFLETLAPKRGEPTPRTAEVRDASEFLGRNRDRVLTASDLATARPSTIACRRIGDVDERDLRFLSIRRVEHAKKTWEIVAPREAFSTAVLPFVVDGGVAHFLLWFETRVAALERRLRQPIFDIPVSARYLNATAAFTGPSPRGAEIALERAFGRAIPTTWQKALGAGEVDPGVSIEQRAIVGAALDPDAIGDLPPDVVIVREDELVRAVAEGRVRDPVVAIGLLRLGYDVFPAARAGDPAKRLHFVNAMTQGSIVQRRLRTYSSIEKEQLSAPTYARLMTLLQHEFGVRVAYPKNEADRSFFKAAFRVFMASDRGEDRALQGLHWSHDAYHFALGNFTLPALAGFEDWYASGEKAPPAPAPEGEPWTTYARALKAAEDEATFFSFWTLFHEQPSLRSHVKQLTYWEALRDMGIDERGPARAIFDAVTTRAELPTEVSTHPLYSSRAEIRSLFDYMLGFRDYHLKDIRAAFGFAAKDPYRGIFLRYGIYEHDLDRYLDWVRSFQTRLDAIPPGLNPLLAEAADVRVAHSLRVWDVVKALKLVRAAAKDASARKAFLDDAEGFLRRLDALKTALDAARARVESAEIVPRNEELFASLGDVASRLETLRTELWDHVESTKLLASAAIAEERTRELPR